MSSAADMERYRRQLASCKGQVTKLHTKANELGQKEPSNIKENAILRLATDMAKQQKTHVELCALLTDTNETDEDNTERFDDSCADLSDILDDLRHLRSLAAADARLKMLFHRIDGALADQAKTTYYKVYPLWEEALRDMENLLGKAGTDNATYYYEAMAGHSHQMAEHTSKHESSPSTAISTTPVRDAQPKVTPVVKTLSVPIFSGDPADFRSWLDRMERYTARLADTSAEVLLSYYLDGMHHVKGKQIITSAMQACLTLDEALDRLRDEFYRPRLVLTQAVKAMSSLGAHDLTATDIQHLLEETQKFSDRILKYGDRSVEQLLAVLTELAMSPALYKEWMTQPEAKKGVPTYETIRTYLRELAITTSNSENHPMATPIRPSAPYKPPPTNKPTPSYKPSVNQGRPFSGGHAQAGRQSKQPYSKPIKSESKYSNHICPACSGSCYKLGYCEAFKAMKLADKKHIVKSRNYCANCLHPAHLTKDCTSSFSCSSCGQRHHSLLHEDTTKAANVSACAGNISTSDSAIASDAICMTARVRITGKSDSVVARALLDSGSQVNLVTRDAVKHLGLDMTPSPMTLQGVGKSTFPASHSVKLAISTCHSRDAPPMSILAMVVESLDIISPPRNFSHARGVDRTHSLQLADPGFYVPAPVDMILGIRVAENIRTGQRLTYQDSDLVAVETALGWVIHSNDGSGGFNTPAIPQHTVCAITLPPDPLDTLVQFWKDEEPPTLDTPTLTFGEEAAVEHFQAHTTITNGRYQVALPRKEPTLVLGDSRRQAVKRLASNHHQLTKKGTVDQFQAAVRDYFDKGHAEEVPAEEIHNPSYYLPMHGVSKESSTTTKLRVVFDASARSSNGSSLNDLLWAGPNTYPLLQDILIQFRNHRIGMSADISQMFREILLEPPDRDYHRFVMYDDSGAIKDVRMLRLTFGVTSSPFLATQTLLKLADDQEDAHPAAAHAIRHHFYVDDCITGCDTLAEATTLRSSLNEALQAGKMTLRKWRTSSPALLATIPDHLRESETDTLLVSSPRAHHKALGVHWNVAEDTLYVATPILADDVDASKRQVSSDIARTFDILGLFTPTTLIMKVLLQDIWRLRVDWDEVLPPDISSIWQSWRSQLHLLASLPIQRPYMDVDKIVATQQLHGFADASLKAYAAVLYVRIAYTDGTVSTALLYAKSKVAPVKGSTVPRLELRAAALLANLLITISRVLDIPDDRIYAWSDSTTVLHWIRTPSPSKFKPFVANRVLAISRLLQPDHWFYVPTLDNPADVASRGCSAELLIHDQLWWKAPPWLLSDATEWPSLLSQHLPAPQDLELRSRAIQILAVSAPDSTMVFLAQFSSYAKMTRVVATLNRLANNWIANKQHLPTSPGTSPSLAELESAERHLWKLQQAKFWPQELIDLRRSGHVTKSSPLHRLSPILQDGLIRVGGRLSHSQLAYKQQHPPILSAKDWITTLLIRAVHHISLHSGPSTMLGLLSARAHVVGAKRALRSLSRKCVHCQRTYARCTNQRMADLPACRVTPAPPFQSVGVDYAGPLSVRILRTRKFITTPGYVALFTCMVTKAIHLELVTDMSADAFLLTFKRFIARRGLPRHVYSDNGGNFVGCRNRLHQLYQQLQSHSTEFSRFCLDRHIDWHFSPGKAPHFGGLWEAGVKSAKTLLHKVVGSHTLTMEELLTTLTEIEAMLNSRPLCPQTSQPDDGVAVLTPGHFLVGRPLLALPEQDVEYHPHSHLTKWKLCSMLTQQFWKRWSTEYLTTLQKRSKWITPQPNYRKDDIVLVRDTDRFQRIWPLARVLDVHPGKDGLVRAVTLQTASGTITRPVHGLVPLITDDDSTTISPEDDNDATSSPEGEDV